MKQVKSYETKDGKLFTDRTQAENHELFINIRGFLQSNGLSGNLTPTEVATLLAKQQTQVYDLIGKYRRTIAAIQSSKSKVIQ